MVMTNIAIENGPFIDGLLMFTHDVYIENGI